METLQADLAAAEARVLRAHAELENYRKRANRHLEDEKKYAVLPLMRDLLPVVDNLERAIQSADQEGGSARLVEGVKMVAQLLAMVLERHHCRRIEAQGAVFDPHVHEAIAQVPSEQVPPGQVLEVAQNGYQLHERVVRPSQVVVSGRPATTPATEAEEP
jgi:molecular chaperone GrpE